MRRRAFEFVLRSVDRGVAQLAERWSPKPEVASSIPAAPASHRERERLSAQDDLSRKRVAEVIGNEWT